MSDDWFTYAQTAELNLTVEAVRLIALRGRWQKTIGNDSGFSGGPDETSQPSGPTGGG